ELKGEKIDIVPWNADQALFVAGALSPAKVSRVEIDDETKTAQVIVPDNQLSLAIGREGQNARLAAKLTGWRIDIKSETQIKEIEAKKLFIDLPPEETVEEAATAAPEEGAPLEGAPEGAPVEGAPVDVVSGEAGEGVASDGEAPDTTVKKEPSTAGDA
ncbi:MAG: KH domain-containing protein, partial [bacterium]